MSTSEEEYFAKRAEEKKLKQIFETYVHMHCPKCGKELKTIDLQGVQIDRCVGCQGIWLDKGELDDLRSLKSTKKSGFFSMLFGDVTK